MNFKKKAILVFASVAVLAGALSLGVNSAKNTQARWNFTSEISEHVQDNIIYPKYQYDEYGNPAWYYDSVTDIARETLDENKEVDIDTRIYGTYNGLQTWQKDEYMDRVIREMRDIVNENPLNYTEEEITASNHSSFTDYLASLNMDKSTYLDYMREITTAYGRNDLNKVQELLQL